MENEMERVLRSKEQARRSYNSLSRWYDLFTGSEKRFTDIGIQMLDVQAGESVLEIGCGTGHALVELAKNLETGEVFAIDLSEGMLKVARKQAQTGNASFCQADGMSLPFPGEQFDNIFLSFTLELFDTPEIPQVLSECRRVLKGNGKIGIVSLTKQETRIVRIYEWFHKRMPTLVDCRPIYLEPALRQAGFAIQRSIATTMWGLPVEITVAKKSLVGMNVPIL